MNRIARFVRWRAGILGLAALVCGGMLFAPALRADDEADAPQASRAVRLSNVDGAVRLFQGNQVLADSAVANTPLFEGTRIETGENGRAEIQFEDGSVARVSPQSALTLTVLRGLGSGGDRDTEVLLNGGLGYFEIQGDTDHIRVRFDDTTVTAGGFTVLRVNLDKAPGEVAVFSGNAHIEGGSSPTLDLHGGESVALNANDPNNYNLAESIEPDSWDTWNSDRDQELTTAAANHTDATDSLPDNKNPAWSDLDSNGNWYNVPDQGYVWSPYEASASDWDPYGNGYWMNQPSYGYAWVSGEAWGYLPYQCGAWNYYSSFGWGWAPGGCNPWWGNGGWAINIGFAPPRYRYPVRPPRRPQDPRPVGGGHIGRPQPLIAVNRHPLPGNTMPAPRDKTGTVMIAGNVVRPLQPIQQTRAPYNHSVPVFGTRPALGAPSAPSTINRPSNGFQGGSAPGSVGLPARPVVPYQPPSMPRPSGSYTPPPAPRPSSFPRPSAPPPVRSAPPSPPPASHPAPASGPHR